MSRIRCFLLESSGSVSVSLRRYSTTFAKGTCSVHDQYHNAHTPIGSEPVVRDREGYIQNGVFPAPPHNDPRWPARCDCGYVFREDDEWQRFTEEIYRRVDTGEECTLRDAQPGAMWYEWWNDAIFVPQGKHCLAVMTPGGEWIIDSQASNCTMPDDRRQERHHCWVLHGDPPGVTVDKNGATCGAGPGSIRCRNWHGFLRNGWLEE